MKSWIKKTCKILLLNYLIEVNSQLADKVHGGMCTSAVTAGNDTQHFFFHHPLTAY